MHKEHLELLGFTKPPHAPYQVEVISTTETYYGGWMVIAYEEDENKFYLHVTGYDKGTRTEITYGQVLELLKLKEHEWEDTMFAI